MCDLRAKARCIWLYMADKPGSRAQGRFISLPLHHRLQFPSLHFIKHRDGLHLDVCQAAQQARGDVGRRCAAVLLTLQTATPGNKVHVRPPS